MWRAVFAVAVAILMLGNAQSKGANGDTQRQQTNASAPMTRSDPPRSPTASESTACPGNNPSKLDCNTLAAVANVRQAEAAERFNNLARFEIGVGIATAVAAICAALFAASAAQSAAKSYRAFVAAEDAALSVEFPDGGVIQVHSDGQHSENYALCAKITNVGRSVARIHGCVMNDELVAGARVLKIDEEWELSYRIMRETAEPFDFVIVYTTPISPTTEMTITAEPRKLPSGHRVMGFVTGSKRHERGGKTWFGQK